VPLKWPPAASQVPLLPLTSVLAVSWAHPGFSEQQATSQATPANSRFGIWGGVASTIRYNSIADLLFLRKCHAPAQSLLRLGPRPRSWVFAPCPGFPYSSSSSSQT
jgi:hypothetical protein